MLWLCTFQLGLIIYVRLLLLIPKIPSLLFDPQDNEFLSWAHSYAALLNQPNCWVPLHQWKASCGGQEEKDFKKRTSSKSANTFDNNNHMWYLLIWWHLTIQRWAGTIPCTFSSVQSSVVSDSLQAHGLRHARPPCPLPTPGLYSNSCPLSWWCHPTISSSVFPFSSCLQSFLTLTLYLNYGHNVTFNFAACSVFAVCSLHLDLFLVAWRLLGYKWLLTLLPLRQLPPATTWAPGSETLNMRVRRICCLTKLGRTPLLSSEAVMEWKQCSFL